MKEPPDPPYRCVKTSLKNVVKDDIVIEKLTHAVLRANGIVIHTLQLLRLYLLHCCEKGDELPTLDRQFVASVMKVFCESSSQGRPPKPETKRIKETLTSFYKRHYKEYISEELNYRHMNTVLDYFERFKPYVEKKNEMNRRLSPVYNEYIFRKLKLGGYMRRQITETRLLKRLEKLFRSGTETIVGIGDWDQRQHRRFKEPVKGKGFRTMFRKAGYNVYLVDEFRTSSACEQGERKTFRVCKNPRPYRSDSILRHGLIRCKTCSRLWNRDTNAASNIWKVAKSTIGGEGRPEYLQRARGSISGATSVGNEVPGCRSTLPRNHDST